MGRGVGEFAQNSALGGTGFCGRRGGKKSDKWGWWMCASGLGSGIGFGGGNDDGKRVRWEAVVSKK